MGTTDATSASSNQLGSITADQLVEEGYALSQLRRWDDAISRYQQAIEHDPDNQKAFRNMGFALNQIGRFESADDFLTTGLSLRTDEPTHQASLFHERAFARAELKKYAEALDDINEAIKIIPHSVKSLYLRARIQLYRGVINEAKRDALEVLRIVPDHTGALRLLDQLA